MAIMQPYFFPYIGYYQLVYASDIFIFYDDVNFMKKSYINRNNILLNGKPFRFSKPVANASQNSLIQDLSYIEEDKILQTVKQAYIKAPYFDEIFPIIESVVLSENKNIAYVNSLSIKYVFEYLNIPKRMLFASEIDYDINQGRADRLIALSRIHGCDQYINSPGGRALYQKEYFKKQGIDLNFIETEIQQYPQSSGEFIPYLSMIDILMNCSKGDIIKMLNSYRLD